MLEVVLSCVEVLVDDVDAGTGAGIGAEEGTRDGVGGVDDADDVEVTRGEKVSERFGEWLSEDSEIPFKVMPASLRPANIRVSALSSLRIASS